MTAGKPIQIIRLSPQLPPSSPSTTRTYSNANTGYPSYSATSQNAPAITYKIRACHQDPVTNQYFILWGDIQSVIKDADYAVDAEDGALVPFMVNEAYEDHNSH
ncbi:hypothetical protein EC957_011628 [Mortierella hygrophila]|uniref:Uncharacterized protein n=1 Tax=Mortierella hygrophila TaxID=979708 RepID=A0A9P6JXE4_9FUNG|nr:hypothetical protein EC957_011628 [Mortierella hygrophila]